MKLFILMCMIFCHIVDDYYLQGLLASAKQKSWWEENAPNEMYKRDYICALICHGLSWSFMIHLPIVVYGFKNYGLMDWSIIFTSWILMALLHSFIDNVKANWKNINLIQYQIYHLLQIILVWGFMLFGFFMIEVV